MIVFTVLLKDLEPLEHVCVYRRVSLSHSLRKYWSPWSTDEFFFHQWSSCMKYKGDHFSIRAKRSQSISHKTPKLPNWTQTLITLFWKSNFVHKIQFWQNFNFSYAWILKIGIIEFNKKSKNWIFLPKPNLT